MGEEDVPFVSVIIPVSANKKVVGKCVDSIFKQSYRKDRFEVILVDSSDDGASFSQKYPLKVVKADVSAGAKRNIGARKAKGTVLALCDDDAVVHRDWLRNLASHFKDPLVAVVGGPNLNPPESTLRQRCSGYLFSSFLGSAQMSTRYQPTDSAVKEAEETDLISCNMAVRKSVMEKLEFPEEIWPNEENIFCHRVKKNGYKLLYDPKAIVWHRRRSIFLYHAKQVFRYGYGRGRMMKMYPSSAKVVHMLPSLFVLFLSAGALLSLLNGSIFIIYSATLLAYSTIVLLTSARIAVRERNWKTFFMLPLAFLLHHCAYGLGMLKGLLLGAKVKANR